MRRLRCTLLVAIVFLALAPSGAAQIDDLVIVRSTIELGHNMGLRVIAEGVEDAETWRILKELGCDMAQGYFVSPPLPVGDFRKWLEGSRWGIGTQSGVTFNT